MVVDGLPAEQVADDGAEAGVEAHAASPGVTVLLLSRGYMSLPRSPTECQ
jgi:hypothetical protein